MTYTLKFNVVKDTYFSKFYLGETSGSIFTILSRPWPIIVYFSQTCFEILSEKKDKETQFIKNWHCNSLINVDEKIASEALVT